MNLEEALQEIRAEYRDDAVVITSDRDRARGDFAAETDGELEVWLAPRPPAPSAARRRASRP